MSKIDSDSRRPQGRGMWVHCGKCMLAKPKDVTPEKWARNNVKVTRDGVQIWCTRHDLNVAHVQVDWGHEPKCDCDICGAGAE